MPDQGPDLKEQPAGSWIEVCLSERCSKELCPNPLSAKVIADREIVKEDRWGGTQWGDKGEA